MTVCGSSSWQTLWVALIVACSSGTDGTDGDLITCSELAERGYRSTAAELTDAPSFGAGEIAPGEAVTLAVPVNEFAERVRVDVRYLDDPDVGINIPSLDTEGDETVLFTLTDTNVPPGRYLLRTVFLKGPTGGSDSLYAASEPEAPYILGAFASIEELERCETAIPAASFIVTDAPSE